MIVCYSGKWMYVSGEMASHALQLGFEGWLHLWELMNLRWTCTKIMSLISNTSLIKMITWLVNSISLCFVCSIIVIHRGWGDVFVLAVGKWGLLVLTYFSHSLFLGACASSYELAHKTCSIQFPLMSNFLKKGSFPNTQRISW